MGSWPFISYNRKICLCARKFRVKTVYLGSYNVCHFFLGEVSEVDSLKIMTFDGFIRRNNNNRGDLIDILHAIIQSASRPLSNWSHSKWHWSIRLCGFHIGDYKSMSAGWPLYSKGENCLTNRHAPKHQSPIMVRTARPPGLDSTQPNIPISVSCRSALLLGQKRRTHCISLHTNCPYLFVLHQPSPSTSLNPS